MVEFSNIREVLEDLKRGKMIVLVDDEDRENEGDLVAAAEIVTTETINFMAKYGRGLICLPLPEEKCDSLGLHPQAVENTAKLQTAFTVSIDARDGITTGISPADRPRRPCTDHKSYRRRRDKTGPARKTGTRFPPKSQRRRGTRTSRTNRRGR